MEIVEGLDYFVRVIPFPTTACGGLTMLNDDGTYSVYLNSKLSSQRLLGALEHELDHIRNDDLYSDKPIEEIERKCQVW